MLQIKTMLFDYLKNNLIKYKKKLLKKQCILLLINVIKKWKLRIYLNELKPTQKIKPYYKFLPILFQNLTNIRLNNFYQQKKYFIEYCNQKYLKFKQLRYTRRIHLFFERQRSIRLEYQQKVFLHLLQHEAFTINLFQKIYKAVNNRMISQKKRALNCFFEITQQRRN